MDYQLSKLDGSGIRIATCEMPQMESVAFGFWAAVGSRNEAREHNGIAHFIEHLLFKGTGTRSALEISRDIEKLGASIDAFTVEDYTGYQVKGPAEHARQLIAIVSDFYQHPNFDNEDIENERSVIHEEILMVRDQPSQHLEDILSYAAWGEHPLGLPITGSPDSLDAITRPALIDFFQQGYAGAQTVFTAAGNITHEQMTNWVGQDFVGMASGTPIAAPMAPTPGPGFMFDAREVEQANLALGFHALDRHDERRFALKLLNIMLGENMSSRLFQLLREDLALCYDVGSEVMAFDDAGLLHCYIALDPENVPEALAAIKKVILSFVESPPSEAELADAKSYTIGQARIALENTSSQMSWMGECLLGHGELFVPEVAYQKLAAVTTSDIQTLAAEIFKNEHLVIAGVAPQEIKAPLQEFRM